MDIAQHTNVLANMIQGYDIVHYSILHRVPKKNVTTFSTITLTISVRLQ